MSLPTQDDATSETSPRWLKRWQSMHSEVVSEEDETEQDLLQIFRRLLEAPANETHAVERAVVEIKAYYKEHYAANTLGLSQMPERGAGYVREIVSSNAFDLAGDLFPGDVNHERLGSLLIELKAQAAKTFDPTDPELGYNDIGLRIVARDHWHHDYGLVSGKSPSVNDCDQWIAVSCLIARLHGANMLGKDEANWAVEDIKECLRSPSLENRQSDLSRNCHILVAANWILLGGSTLTQALKSDPEGGARGRKEKTGKELAAILKEANDMNHKPSEETNPAHWKLKETVTKARQRIMELGSVSKGPISTKDS